MMDIGKIAVIHVAKYLDGNDRLCHHDCMFCMERMEPGDSDEKLPSIEEVDRSLFQYTSERNLSKIYIAGGEPTLREDFGLIVQTVQKYCRNIILSTSCDFENNVDMLDSIKQLGIKHVATSVHSHLPSIHDRLTGVEGSFEKTISAIRDLIDMGISITVNAVINSYNVCEMRDIVEFFEKERLQIDKLTLTHYMNHGNAYYHQELKFNVDEYSEYVSDAITKAAEVDYMVTFRNFPICLDYRLAEVCEGVECIDIIDLNAEMLDVMDEKAPAFTKDKCHECEWFTKCPHYLMSNYGEE